MWSGDETRHTPDEGDTVRRDDLLIGDGAVDVAAGRCGEVDAHGARLELRDLHARRSSTVRARELWKAVEGCGRL